MIPYVACRHCPACLNGRTNCCENISVIGVHRDGGFSEYLCVPVNNLLVVDDVDPEAVALIEPFAIARPRGASQRSSREIRCWWSARVRLGSGRRRSLTDGAQVVVADTSPARRDHVAQHLGLTTSIPPIRCLPSSCRQRLAVLWRRK